MSFLDSVRRLLPRGEADEIHRSTAQIMGHWAMDQAFTDELAALRLRSAVDDRHPDLPAAIERRNAAR